MATTLPNAPGKSDIYLHVQCKRAGKVKGEGKAAGHVDDIQIESWAWGITSASAVDSTQARARRQWSSLTLFKRIDLASTGLFAALCTNDEIKEARLTMRKSGGDPLDYYTIKLTGARLEQVSQEVHSSGEVRERIDIVFSTCEITYKQQDASGRLANNVSFMDEIYPSS